MGDAYWETTGATKTFTHPLDPAWLPAAGRILDYGCGYGRLAGSLASSGFADVRGVDISSALIARARESWPDLRFDVLTDPPAVDAPPSSVDVLLLFAVLTCVPDPADQRALIAEVTRLLAPGGLVYVSDLVIDDDPRNQRRYADYCGALPYGTFVTDDGVTCRHHDAAYLAELLSGFEIVRERRLTVETMNGNRSPAVQLLGRRR